MYDLKEKIKTVGSNAKEFLCLATEVGINTKLYVEFSSDNQSIRVSSEDGLLNFEMIYANEASDATCTVYYATEDGKGLYDKMKADGRNDLASKYAHIEEFTSEQLEKCQVEIRYAQRRGSFEFKGMGPFEVYNGTYELVQ